MLATLLVLLSLDYLLLGVFSYSSIENFRLDDFFNPVRLYDPFYSEIFSFESILLYFIVAGAVLATQVKKHLDAETSVFPVNLAVFFAVASVPVKMATKGLVVYDTAYFAFVLVGSILLLYCFARILFLPLQKVGKNEFIMVLVVLIVGCIVYEPWNSPVLKIQSAIEAGDAARFSALADKYPVHIRAASHFLSLAFKRPNFAIIKTLVSNGNKYMATNRKVSAIFDEANLEILKYLHSQGLSMASMDILRDAVRYTAKTYKSRATDPANSKINRSYPTLKFLLKLYREAPEEERKQKDLHSGDCGFSSLSAVAAVEGDASLMAFLAGEGFKIDEDAIQALTLNKYLEKPEIQTLLMKTEFTEITQPTAVSAELAASATVQLPVATSPNPGSATITTPKTTPITEAVLLPAPEGLFHQSNDGFDLIMTSGNNIKKYREDAGNIFHFLARDWHAKLYDERFYLEHAELFAAAMQRKVDINHKNKYGLTPLWEALNANNVRAAVMFLANGADQNVCDSDGLSMREFCLKNKRLILLSLLEEGSKNEKQ